MLLSDFHSLEIRSWGFITLETVLLFDRKAMDIQERIKKCGVGFAHLC